MRAIKALLALLLVATCALVAVRIVLPPYRCNEVKARANAAVIVRDRARNSEEQIRRARRLAEECERCLRDLPNDAELMMLLAANQHVLGLTIEAEQNYHHALALNERAETYAFLALLQLDQGRIDEAKKNLTHACTFDISLVELVSSPMREEIYETVMQRHEKLRGGSRPTS
jgi:hypothetical protein